MSVLACLYKGPDIVWMSVLACLYKPMEDVDTLHVGLLAATIAVGIPLDGIVFTKSVLGRDIAGWARLYKAADELLPLHVGLLRFSIDRRR